MNIDKLQRKKDVAGLIKALGDRDENVRSSAADALGKIGNPRAVEPLIAAIGDGDWLVRSSAAEALGKIGDPRAVEPLRAAIDDRDENVHSDASEALDKIGEPTVDLLITALGDEDSDVRKNAAYALGGLDDKRAVEPLITALGARDADVRRGAVNALGEIGEPAIYPLIASLGDEDSDVRKNAAYALGKIGEPAIYPLIASLGDEDSDVRKNAAYALGMIGDLAVEPLIAVLGDNYEYARSDVFEALGKIGEPAINPLIAALGEEDSDVRKNAAYALGKIGEPAIEPLITALGAGGWYLYWGVAYALGEVGEPAVDPLITALRDGNSSTRRGVARALGKIGDVRAVDPLIAALADGYEHARSDAAEALDKIGEPAIDPLIAALGGEDSDVRKNAAYALGKIGEPAIEPLITTLGIDDFWVCFGAAMALAKIGKPAVDPLIAALGDDDSCVRLGAAEALGEIGDMSAIAPLIVAIDDASWWVRWNAIDALGKIADPKTVLALEKATNDSDERVIAKAREVLDTIKSSDEYKDYLKEQALEKAYEETFNFISFIESETTGLKSSGVKILEAERLLKQAKAELNKNNFEPAKELANRAMSTAERKNVEYGSAVRSIYEAEGVVKRVGAEGVVVSDELLTDSKRAIGDGDYEIAITLAEEQKSLVTNQETRYREAMKRMKSTESAIERVEELGCEISSALGLLKQANSTSDIGNYEESIEYAKQGQETVKRIQKESKPEIDLKFPEGIFKLNAWKQTEITITNTGSMHAKEIEIEPAGDIEFTRYEIPLQLNRNETKRIPIHMKPTVMGDVPIDITIAFKDALDREYTSSKDLCVLVAESVPMSQSISINEFSTRQGQSEYKYQVTISYAGEDREYAEGLAVLLKNKNISFFYDKYEQADLWGKDLYQHLQSVYRDKAQYCVVFLSHAYAQKLWTRHELESAQARAFREHKEYILPVKIDDTEIPGINETIGYIDLKSTSLEEIADMLVKKLSSQNLKE